MTSETQAPETIGHLLLTTLSKLADEGAILLLHPQDHRELVSAVQDDLSPLYRAYELNNGHLTLKVGRKKFLVEPDTRIRRGAVHLSRRFREEPKSKE